jgi:hypothetical protein
MIGIIISRQPSPVIRLWRLTLPPADHEKRGPENGADNYPEAMKVKIDSDSIGDFCANQRSRDAEHKVS